MSMFKTQQELNNHTKISHTDNFKCNKCEKVFTNHNSLLQHSKTKHEDKSRLPVGHQSWTRNPGNTKFVCSYCPHEFNTKADLNVHQITHQGKDIPCNQCEDMFETKQDLGHHIRTTHRTNEGNFTREKRQCRYFLQGRCTKGYMCLFSHERRQNVTPQKVQGKQPPACRRGYECEFWARCNCHYSHRGSIEQEFRVRGRNSGGRSRKSGGRSRNLGSRSKCSGGRSRRTEISGKNSRQEGGTRTHATFRRGVGTQAVNSGMRISSRTKSSWRIIKTLETRTRKPQQKYKTSQTNKNTKTKS